MFPTGTTRPPATCKRTDPRIAVKRDAPQWQKALLTRCLAVAVLAVTALLLVACSAGSGAGQLTPGVVQEGAKYCAGAPSVPVNGIPAWNSPIGWAVDWYYNASASPSRPSAAPYPG